MPNHVLAKRQMGLIELGLICIIFYSDLFLICLSGLRVLLTRQTNTTGVLA
jgi:hypothetical protein